jgi:hypothetical protein
MLAGSPEGPADPEIHRFGSVSLCCRSLSLSLSIRVSVDHHAQGQACHVTAPSSCYAASSASPQVVGSRPGGTELVTFRFAVYPKAKLLNVINFLEPTLTRERDLGCINSGHVNSNKHAI